MRHPVDSTRGHLVTGGIIEVRLDMTADPPFVPDARFDQQRGNSLLTS
jgi:hypothetical protein